MKEVTIDVTEIERITMNQPKEIDKFLDIYNLPRLNNEKIEI